MSKRQALNAASALLTLALSLTLCSAQSVSVDRIPATPVQESMQQCIDMCVANYNICIEDEANNPQGLYYCSRLEGLCYTSCGGMHTGMHTSVFQTPSNHHDLHLGLKEASTRSKGFTLARKDLKLSGCTNTNGDTAGHAGQADNAQTRGC